MPRFSYKAATASGEVIHGEIDAADRQAVIDRLRSQGHVPIRADERAIGLARSFSLPLISGHRHLT
jgi:type II secretory pathway component PulF